MGRGLSGISVWSTVVYTEHDFYLILGFKLSSLTEKKLSTQTINLHYSKCFNIFFMACSLLDLLTYHLWVIFSKKDLLLGLTVTTILPETSG